MYNGTTILKNNTQSTDPADGSSSQNHTLSFIARTADNGANITCQLTLVDISDHTRTVTVVASASALLTVKGKDSMPCFKSRY